MYKYFGPFSYEYQPHWTMVSQNDLQLNWPNSASLKSLISLSIQMIRKQVLDEVAWMGSLFKSAFWALKTTSNSKIALL